MICNYNTESAVTEKKCDECSTCLSRIMVLVGIIGGIVFAAAGVLLFIASLITVPFTAVLTALITSIVYLLILLIVALTSERGTKVRCCIRKNIGGLIFGIFGTIFASILAVATDLTTVSVIAAVLIGLTFFFFAYMIISVLFLILCAVK